jgi:hypothetical protein
MTDDELKAHVLRDTRAANDPSAAIANLKKQLQNASAALDDLSYDADTGEVGIKNGHYRKVGSDTVLTALFAIVRDEEARQDRRAAERKRSEEAGGQGSPLARREGGPLDVEPGPSPDITKAGR